MDGNIKVEEYFKRGLHAEEEGFTDERHDHDVQHYTDVASRKQELMILNHDPTNVTISPITKYKARDLLEESEAPKMVTVPLRFDRSNAVKEYDCSDENDSDDNIREVYPLFITVTGEKPVTREETVVTGEEDDVIMDIMELIESNGLMDEFFEMLDTRTIDKYPDELAELISLQKQVAKLSSAEEEKKIEARPSLAKTTKGGEVLEKLMKSHDLLNYFHEMVNIIIDRNKLEAQDEIVFLKAQLAALPTREDNINDIEEQVKQMEMMTFHYPHSMTI